MPISWITQNSLSWGTDNRTLAFVYGQWGGREGVQLLDSDRPGSGLLANSRVAVPPSRTTSWTQVQLTADGQTIIGKVNNPYVNGTVERLVEVSAQTGKVVRVLDVTRHMADDVRAGPLDEPVRPDADRHRLAPRPPPLDGAVRGRRCRDAGGWPLHDAARSENTLTAAW
jgi:hypothetical protein